MGEQNPSSSTQVRNALIVFASFILGIFFVINVSLTATPLPPRFRLEYASISLNTTSKGTDSADQVMAEWSIGFSVMNPNGKMNTIVYKDFSVSVNSLLGSTKTATFPDFHQKSGKRTSFDTVVRGPLPRFNTTNSFMLTFDVDLQTRTRYLNWLRVGHKLRLRKITCPLLKIELQPFQTYGVRLGSPVECYDPNESDALYYDPNNGCPRKLGYNPNKSDS